MKCERDCENCIYRPQTQVERVYLKLHGNCMHLDYLKDEWNEDLDVNEYHLTLEYAFDKMDELGEGIHEYLKDEREMPK